MSNSTWPLRTWGVKSDWVLRTVSSGGVPPSQPVTVDQAAKSSPPTIRAKTSRIPATHQNTRDRGLVVVVAVAMLAPSVRATILQNRSTGDYSRKEGAGAWTWHRRDSPRGC